ncbi:hypothetical protein Tco_0453531 [Tanacetum coccineum]
MTNKIDTVLEAITDRIAGTLPSDTVKNLKLGTRPVSSARSYLNIDPQCSSHPSTSINAIKAHFNDAIIEPQQPEEPEPTFKDEFKDLHLNLPVLEVLAYALIYNAILDKYIERRGFLATTNAVIDCKMAKIAVREGITRDTELNPFKDTLVFRRMVEFLGAIPINLKCNMWESEDLIIKPINWDKPPKNEDGAWHAKIRLIDPDGEEFTKTLQSIPITRKLFERESPREIIDLDHFYDT